MKRYFSSTVSFPSCEAFFVFGFLSKTLHLPLISPWASLYVNNSIPTRPYSLVRNSTTLQTNTLECRSNTGSHAVSPPRLRGYCQGCHSAPVEVNSAAKAVLERKICCREQTWAVWYDDYADWINLSCQKLKVAVLIFPQWSQRANQ